MQKRMSEKELLSHFDEALEKGYIFAYYQPQFNHSTGRMIGAEALMRWVDPKYGMQYPSDFIPVLEEQDLLYKADIKMVEVACKLLRFCFDNHLPVVPISFNMSRNDIYKHEYVEEVEKIRDYYSIPVRYLRVEITETSAIGGTELVAAVIEKFHKYGYIVEMDDFGSGYSSLNILKDLNVDIIKLDLKFLDGGSGGRGGIIIKSVVQMAKWLKTPVIAEGVETAKQADFMNSIGCNYLQGYLYSKPLPEEQFLEKIQITIHETMTPATNYSDEFDVDKFWDPESFETMIFSNFVGGAAIFSYDKGDMELIRVNKKYIETISMNLSEKDFVDTDPATFFAPGEIDVFVETIKKAIVSHDEEICDTWRTFTSRCCGKEDICIRTSMRLIGNAESEYIFYAIIQNVTAEKKIYASMADSEKRFKYAFEHSNTYAWEYVIDSKEMRPCFRCMRDLGLPPLLKNYPEPAIEVGIIPFDYADMYRDWHKQLEKGTESLEGIIPLTKQRIPFVVKYTTEFDDNGRPVKAYGSATAVAQNLENAD